MNLEEKLYTSTEVAQILGVSLRSVYRYLEEGKLDAEVKTATGRHRFTKQNILDFLYPNNSQPSSDQKVEKAKPVSDTSNDSFSFRRQREASTPAPTYPTKKKEEFAAPLRDETLEKPVKTKIIEPEEEIAPEEKEEPIDWLAKFREAAKKFREEEETPVAPAPVEREETRDRFDLSDNFTSLRGQTVAKEEPVAVKKPVAEEKQFFFYRSMLGGLKDIAQNIDKNAKKSYVEYAFTRNAGLSLHKPIRPFSLLHSYIKDSDKDFFEKALHLVPSDENNAQLCLIVSRNSALFSSKKEMHNLYVVSDAQLRKDLVDAGEEDLVREFDSVLGF